MSGADRLREAVIEVRERLVLPTDADDALVIRTLFAAWEEMHTPTPFVNISKARFEAMAAVVEAAQGLDLYCWYMENSGYDEPCDACTRCAVLDALAAIDEVLA